MANLNARNNLWEAGHDEVVEVNQRALIEKILARYSGEYTVFRELLQNSDDAQASAVEIHFETQKYIDKQGEKIVRTTTDKEEEGILDLNAIPVHRWVFKNNGILFRDQDWTRLKKIAEGNPDEQKIGAFGVGFYSLFSITEEPFVMSGDEWMGFYWKDKKDQLFVRRGSLSKSSTLGRWTSFEMQLRESAPIPGAFDFIRFLASSITFMTHLSEITVFFDDRRLAKLTKVPGVTKGVDIPKTLKRSSTLNTMHVAGVKSTPLTIHAEVMQCVYAAGTNKPQTSALNATKLSSHGRLLSSLSNFFSNNHGSASQHVVKALLVSNPLAVVVTRVTLSVFTAEVDVKLEPKMASELQRSIKKSPPKSLKYDLIYTSKDDYDVSIDEDNHTFATGSVFQGLRADLDGGGFARIFIGHSTGQTTGIGGHMASRFIPTVERELIDLVDRNVAVWNKELLYVGGFLARVIYELELAHVRKLWDGVTRSHSKTETQFYTSLHDRALHATKFFTFHSSTPSSEVSNHMEETFLTCSNSHTFPILSTVGVRNVADVRLSTSAFSGFVKRLPVVPDEMSIDGNRMISALQGRSMIKIIQWADVLGELKDRSLSEEEMIACFKWWIGLHQQGTTQDLLRRRTELLDAAVLMTGTLGNPVETVLRLNAVQTFINIRSIGGMLPMDNDAPLPKHLLPLSISRHFDPASLQSCFPWRELSVVDWLRHVITPDIAKPSHDINKSASWAEQVFLVLSRAWPSLSKGDQGIISKLLKDKTCVPTNSGLQLPDKSYFARTNIFKDLPIVTLPSGKPIKGTLESVFVAVGVRKQVGLEIVLDKMIQTGDWTAADLVKYLANAQNALSATEMEQLRATSAFIKETMKLREKQRFRADELYEPRDIFRQLGLPIIDWGITKWRASSEEAKFLYKLGLRRSPPLKVIIELSACTDNNIRSLALKYFLDNYNTRYRDYNPVNFSGIAFIPALDQLTPCMGMHKEVFSADKWASFGFLVAHPNLNGDMLTKLKIRDRPESPALISILEKTPPKDEATAQKWFGILADHVSDFSQLELEQLSQMPIVPTNRMYNKGNTAQHSDLCWLPPKQCFFAGDARAQFHSKLFPFVDFGARANMFLSACGTKREPGVDEVARILLDDPRKFYELANGPDLFLVELRNIAFNHGQISQNTLNRMKKAPILLAIRRKRRQVGHSEHKQPSSTDSSENEWELQYDLRKPDQIVVVADDMNGYQLFCDQIFTCPQDDLLENFYTLLGSRRLSSLIREDYKPFKEVKNSTIATRSLILERLPLFLHDHPNTRIRYSWLAVEKNFIIRTFNKLTVTSHLEFGHVRARQHQEASAHARQIIGGPIELWLTEQYIMYEVAISLCRLLLDTPKSNDALLLSTILSTDLRALIRLGYNVDRILKQHKETQAAEEAARLANQTMVQKMIRKLGGKTDPVPPVIVPSGGPSSGPSLISSGPSLISSGQSQTFTITPPQSNIARNVNLAVQACTQEQGHLLHNRDNIEVVKESLDEGYCNNRGGPGDLELIDTFGTSEATSIKVFVCPDIPDIRSIMSTKHEALARFVQILQPLSTVYKLPLTSLHIFYDVRGELIAFNRNASIFLNLRYYEDWHDKNVQKGSLSTAYISWFFTLAHEIAHNLVQPHNSEHEFYFSAICEAHIMQLGQLLNSA